VLVAPQRRYDANFLHRWLLGSNHRRLWAQAVRVPVLDLDSYAGGLAVPGLGGGQQTQSLRFRGRDGRNFAFRSVDKDASRSLDPELRRSIAADVLQDQVSALLHMSAIVVAPLLRAASVLHADPQLVAMPDDPRLSEHRVAFAGLPGLIEERPAEGPHGEPGFAGASAILEWQELLDTLAANPAHWHSAVGGGLWLAALAPQNVLSIALARSDERTGVYLRAGFLF
jgi:hypothetical protein